MLDRRLFVLMLALASASALAQPPPRLVTVSGHGEVATQPDRARLVLGVTQMSPQLDEAQDKVNAVVRDYLAAARKLGAAAEQISTTGASIQPEYIWDEQERRQKLAGYRVTRQIALRVDDLGKLGEFILQGTEAGINQLQPPVLESSRAEALRRQALVEAAQDARAKAQLLAETLGARLGPLHGLQATEGDWQAPVPMKMAVRSASFDSGSEEMGINFGEIRYEAALTADFDLIVEP